MFNTEETVKYFISSLCSTVYSSVKHCELSIYFFNYLTPIPHSQPIIRYIFSNYRACTNQIGHRVTQCLSQCNTVYCSVKHCEQLMILYHFSRNSCHHCIFRNIFYHNSTCTNQTIFTNCFYSCHYSSSHSNIYILFSRDICTHITPI